MNRDTAVRAFLHDGELNAASEMILAEPVSSGVIIEVSTAAADKGMRHESAILTRLALGRGWIDGRPPIGVLLDVMMDVSGKEELCNLTERILKMKRARTCCRAGRQVLERYACGTCSAGRRGDGSTGGGGSSVQDEDKRGYFAFPCPL